MTTPDADFANELEIFRREAEGCSQFFYAYLAIHAVTGDVKPVFQSLNESPLFWNTTLAALQASTFMVLGRIFDQKSPHNIDRLLGIAQRNRGIFSRLALEARRQGRNPTRPAWLHHYVLNAYEPTPEDFRRLRKHIQRRRRVYENNYRDLRDKIFAHKELTDPQAVTALFAKTNIRELQRMLAFLRSIHEALWELFENGKKPVLRPLRYSVKRIRDIPSPSGKSIGVQERITHEVERFLTKAVGLSQARKH